MARTESFLTLDLIGHLFDTGMISKVLDAIEDSSTSAHIVDFKLGKDRTTPTELRLQLFAPAAAAQAAGTASPALESLTRVIDAIQEIASCTGVNIKLEGESTYIHEAVMKAKAIPRSNLAPGKRVLVLGAGFVSAPLVEYLLRRNGNHLTLASMIKEEAVTLAGGRPRVCPIQLDVGKVRAACC
jgi:hypothetical protein